MKLRTLVLSVPLTFGSVACFGMFTPVQVVPAAQAPKPPPGSGWSCVDYAHVTKTSSTSGSKCFRTAETCTDEANAQRRQPGYQIGFCQPVARAYCTATFTNQSDANFSCSKSLKECGPVGIGFGGVPGTKQSECAEYN